MFVKVNTQELCFFDSQLYLSSGSYTVNQSTSGQCMESYIYTISNNKVYEINKKKIFNSMAQNNLNKVYSSFIFKFEH